MTPNLRSQVNLDPVTALWEFDAYNNCGFTKFQVYMEFSGHYVEHLYIFSRIKLGTGRTESNLGKKKAAN